MGVKQFVLLLCKINVKVLFLIMQVIKKTFFV